MVVKLGFKNAKLYHARIHVLDRDPNVAKEIANDLDFVHVLSNRQSLAQRIACARFMGGDE